MSSYEGAFSLSFRVLRSVGLWNLELNHPPKVVAYNCYRCVAVTFLFVIMLFMLIDFALSLDDVLKWSFNLSLTITVTTSFFKATSILWHIDDINRLRSGLHRDLSKESIDNRQIMTAAMRETTIILRTLFIMFHILLVVWMSIPFSGIDDLRLPYNMWLPYDPTPSPIYELTYALYGVFALFLVLTVFGMDTSVVAMTNRICAEYDILKNNIKKLCQPEGYVSTSDEQASSQLRDIVRHHQRIIGFVDELQKSYKLAIIYHFIGTPLLLINVGLDIILVSSKVSLRLIMQIGYSFNTLVDLSLYCVFGTRLIAKSEELANVIFGAGWYSMRPSHRRILSFVIHRTQKPPRLTVGPLYAANLNLYLEILKTTYNILAVMWQVAAASRDA